MNRQRGGYPSQRGRGRSRRDRGRGSRNHLGEEVREEFVVHERRGRRRNKRGGNNTHNRRSVALPLGYRMLEDLAQLDPHEALHKLASHKTRLVELLKESDIRFDLMTQLTRALANICNSSISSETFLDIIDTLHAEAFMDNHLATFLCDWPQVASEDRSYRRTVPSLLMPVIVILFSLLSPYSLSGVDAILSDLEIVLDQCGEMGIFFPKESLCKLDELKDYYMEMEEYANENQHETTRRDLRSYSNGPPPEDDFREYPIFPMANELRDTFSPSLRVNIIKGGYHDADHYLDVQFRLLREDLVKPLRDGIFEYRSAVNLVPGRKPRKLQDICVYHDVRVIEAKPGSDGISYLTRFSVDHLKRVEWEKSKRLIYGSLVCLSSDDFETVVFAVVTNRQGKDLKKGLIELSIHGIYKTLSSVFSETFTMVESPAYFEAYRHVLKRLQDTTEANFPLKQYIVEAVPKVSLPRYLRKNPCARYDLKTVSRRQGALNIVISKPWPPMNRFDLDPSQLEAFKAALTEELCLIQGPPGTGKTFIGLKIVETLLHNITVWSPDGDPSPILLICYTNHALDQFLEGVLSFLPNGGIIRIGGRSSSEKLKEYNLSEMRRKRKRPKRLRTHVKSIRDEMIRLAKSIEAIQKIKRVSHSKILPEKELNGVIPRGQYRSLVTGYLREYREIPKAGEYLTFWLNAVVGDDKTLHEDVAPPLNIKTINMVTVPKERKGQHVLKGRRLHEHVRENLHFTNDIISSEIIKTNDVWSLSLIDRWRLYRYWLKRHQQRLQKLLQVAQCALLKEDVLRPFISKEHWQSLQSSVRGFNVVDGQLLSSYLGVVRGNIGELIEHVKFDAITDKEYIMILKSVKVEEELCAVAIGEPLLQIYITKALAQFDTMSKCEAQSVHDVYQLSYRNRWRMYKHWLSIFTEQLQERLNASKNNILREDSLKPQMTNNQFMSLRDPSKDEDIQKVDHGQLLILWLAAYNGVPLRIVQEVIGKVPQESERIDVKGTAELLAEARYIDDGNDKAISDALEDIVDRSTDDEEDDEIGADGAGSVGHDEEWNIAGRNVKSIRKQIIKNLRKNDRFTEKKAADVKNVWDLPLSDRWNLYRYWVHLYNRHAQNSLLPLYEKYNKQVKLLKEVREQEDVEIVRQAKVMALTTTGASKYHNLIERVHPKIVIVEEAAEVLEAHIVTSLTKKCQHLILIGDHQQLRPNPTVYELSTRYGLDISLFERLIKNHFPRHRLNLQHRMRPEISHLLKIHGDFYPGLEDHESVFCYPNIQGVVKNVFFLDHTFQESKHHDNHSRSNRFEAEFLAALCRYLLQQGYKPGQITILTAYTGQLWNFQSLMSKSVFKDVHVCPVDSYQGEENDIILLSLVRSNEERSIGFLKTANRVCVALSRAKKGLYCVGNFSLLSGENDLWSVITHALRQKGSLGKRMQLKCANHPRVVTEVSAGLDFKAVPDGGCSKPCRTLLNCGHVCPLSCHPVDPEHITFKCRQKCTRPICGLNHMCGRLCFEECESQCQRMVQRQLVCGHSKLLKCFQRNSPNQLCEEPCRRKLICGHPCNNRCWEDCTTSCRATVKVELQCGHEVLTMCGNKTPECTKPCGEMLMCGHVCRGTCTGCRRGRLHVECARPCRRKLICGHTCTSVCSTYCPPCEKSCENVCIHTKCGKKCWEICTPCEKRCAVSCVHKICLLPCSKPCVGQPCDKPCRRIIRCGHECIGLCGNKCPAKCRKCDKIDETIAVPTLKGGDPARFVQLEDCGHVIEMSVLDKWMTAATDENYSVIEVKVCPQCTAPIRRSHRYNHLIKQTKIDAEDVKKRISRKHTEIFQKITNAGTVAETTVANSWDFILGKYRKQTKLNGFSNSAGLFLYNIHKQAGNVSVSVSQITSLKYKLDMFKQLCEFKQKANRISDKNGNDLKKRLLENTLLDILGWIDSLSYVGKQNEDDWNCEVKRVSAFLKLMEARVSVTKNPFAEDVMEKIFAFVKDSCRYSISKQLEVRVLFWELEKYDTNLIYFKEGRKLVVNVLSWSSGDWLKCQKGHIYCLGEKANTGDRKKCPECEQAIGSRSYDRLAPLNRLTTAMAGCQIVSDKFP